MPVEVRGTAQFPEKALFLFKPAPYKVMYGGRGGSKSWDIARALLILGTRRKLFILCAREIQKSIKESVHKLLADQVIELGFHAHRDEDGNEIPARYEVQDSKIVGSNGTTFVFFGVRNNIASIKSVEAIDIAWVEEATFVSSNSWEVLLPTVRRDPPFGPFGQGSEVWISFNPELASDETYKRWVADPPPGAKVIEVNWRDNPWFPEILRKQKDELRRKDPDSYLTVWEGKPRRVLQGAIYSAELSLAIKEGRISSHIKVDRGRGVVVAFDLGRSDMCAMWFIQQVGMEHHAVDFYGNCGFGMDHYLEEIQQRKYLISSIWLPHDATAHHQAAKNTIEQQVKAVYPGEGKVKIIPRVANITNGINATRMLFPRLYFNEQTCADGILALQHYQYEVDPETKERSKNPLHNWASNPADALRTYSQGLREGAPPKQEKHEPGMLRPSESQHAWMAI